MIVDFSKDSKSKDNTNYMIIITILPIKKFHYFDNADSNIIVEKIVKKLKVIII